VGPTAGLDAFWEKKSLGPVWIRAPTDLSRLALHLLLKCYRPDTITNLKSSDDKNHDLYSLSINFLHCLIFLCNIP
jgi:hypothetical protein